MRMGIRYNVCLYHRDGLKTQRHKGHKDTKKGRKQKVI